MTDRVAIVTGGTGALGQAIARAFLAAGASLVIPFKVQHEVDALRAWLTPAQHDRVLTIATDVTDPSAMEALARTAESKLGRLDVLVTAVGGFSGGDLVSTTPESWEQMLSLNLTSTFLACRAVLPAMIRARAGRIVNIASRAVLPPRGGFLAYTVAKSGVIALTQALAEETRPHGITVNAVLPSTMDTPANRQAMPDADRSQWVSVDSVAATVAFLASDAARDVTGSLVTV